MMDIEAQIATAIRIADELGETGQKARLHVASLLLGHGIDELIATAERAKEIHAGEGLLRKDGTRRSLGGVFFVLFNQKKRGIDDAQRAQWKAELAQKAREAAARNQEKKATKKAAKIAAQEEFLDRYRKQKAELFAARDELAAEKERREKAERELDELRRATAQRELASLRGGRPVQRSVQQRPARPSAPTGRVFRAFDDE